MSATAPRPRATVGAFAAHEFRLAWRDAAATLTGGGRRRRGAAIVALGVFAVFVHGLAYGFLDEIGLAGFRPTRPALALVSGLALLAWCLMLSQAIESAARAFYARGDLDLILSSPAPARNLFAVRIVAVAATASTLAILLASPAVDVAVVLGGPRWLAAYGAAFDLGLVAAAVAVALTVAMFRLLGPARTRTVAQIVSAVVGAAFAILIQGAAVLAYGSPNRLAILTSEAFLAHAPGEDSLLWWPARAILGDPLAFAACTSASVLILAASVATFAPFFETAAYASSGLSQDIRRLGRGRRFRLRSPVGSLLVKEWTLLARDPWLLSQTLMQILYLVPAALLLWRSFGEGASALAVLVPVLVMAAGQLAGGLAWLAVSGEDAPDLVATAPVTPGLVLRAKIAAVLGAVALAFSPLIAVLAVAAPDLALVSAAGIAAAAVCATLIQIWFRGQAKRSQFRRRQTSSRVATFAEAFSSILWASTGALVAGGAWILAAATAALTLLVLGGARLLRPAPASGTG